MKPPFNRLALAAPAVDVVPRSDGGCVLRCPQPLAPYGRCIGDDLAHWARAAPDRVFLAERREDATWRELRYGEALEQVRRIGQALVERDLSAERPVAILSDNSIDHALIALAAMHVGVPVAPISPSYSLASRDFAKLRHALDLLSPGLVFVQDAVKFAAALAAVDVAGVEVVTSGTLSVLAGAVPDARVDRAFRAVGPETVAKILFTSGSTDLPKGVINTQRMMCANQQAIAQIWPFLAEKPPVIVDWLPWSHTFGGNHNFNMMLRHGGTLYIDDGKPVPGLVERTVANLAAISPTISFNVPRGYHLLLPYLEEDEALRSTFFRRLDLIFYAAAALPQNLWERLEDVARAARGERVRLLSSWGATETAPLATSVHGEMARAGVIGLPVPGIELKMAPSGERMELCVRGPHVTPGYFKRPDLTRAAFDDEGYYCSGDAGRFADPGEPLSGIVFDGRIAEDFKLSSGTWVHVGALRVKAIAAGAPAILDCVVTGHDRSEVGLLIFPNASGCRSLCDAPADLPLAALVASPAVVGRIREALVALAREATGSSTYPTRALVMDEPPSGDANEITDKGYINQRAVLMRRAALVERLHADRPDAGIIVGH